jgi:hypothetical protein
MRAYAHSVFANMHTPKKSDHGVHLNKAVRIAIDAALLV